MNKFILGLVVLGLGVVVGWFALGGAPASQTADTPTPTLTPADVMQDYPTTPSATQSAVVTYADTGFSPSVTTITVGSTVTFTNESSKSMWVASAVHPTHSLLPGFDQLASVGKGVTYEYTFIKVGTWKYHNHMNPTDTGSVVVQ